MSLHSRPVRCSNYRKEEKFTHYLVVQESRLCDVWFSSFSLLILPRYIMETEHILASELQDLSEEYGLSRESESAAASSSDDPGTLDQALNIDTNSGSDIPLDSACDWVHVSEDGEVALVKCFLQAECGCKMGKDGKPCTSSLTFHDVFEYRDNCHELTSDELDMVILGQLNAHCSGSASVASSSRSSAAATYLLS